MREPDPTTAADTEARPLRPRLARAALAALTGAIAAFALSSLVPAIESELGPSRLGSRIGLGSGRTVLEVPPFGTLSAPTHLAPLDLQLSLRQVEFRSLTELAATESGRERLLTDINDDLRSVAIRSAGRTLLGAAVIGGIVVAVLFGRKWRWVATGAAGGLVAVAIGIAAVGATFDSDGFDDLTFSGALVDAPELIETMSRGASAVDELQSRYETATKRLANVLVLMAEPDTDPREDAISILHVGDIHSNPLGLRLVEDLAREFDVDAVLDTGDITSYGEAVEENVVHFVRDVPVPYVFVRGNHDSPSVESALDRLGNVTVLDGETLDVEGIRILGWGDPTYTESHENSFDEVLEIKADEAPEVAAAVEQQQPDVLAVHDARIAEGAVGSVPLILAGHYHEQGFEESDETVTLTVGSTGAAGIKSFTLEADMNYEAEIVYFREGEAVAVDYLTFRGVGSDFELERRTFPAPEE